LARQAAAKLSHDRPADYRDHDTGLKVRAELDENKYPGGVKVSDAQMAAINLSRHAFHGDWNYTIAPRDKVLASTRK
jgi:hypothetical protein